MSCISDLQSTMSNRQFILSNGVNGRQKRFSIDDAFEEETDEAIRVYGTTGQQPKSPMGQGDCCNGLKIDSGRYQS